MLKRAMVFSALSLFTLIGNVKSAPLFGTIYTTKYESVSLSRSIASFEENGHVRTLAQHLCSEKLALRAVREGKIKLVFRELGGEKTLNLHRFMSIQSVLEQRGCQISCRFSGEAMDNLLVVPNDTYAHGVTSGWIDQLFPPIFLESMSIPEGCPEVSSIETLSQQLSIRWSDSDSGPTGKGEAPDEATQVRIQFPHMNEVIMEAQFGKFLPEFLSDISWLESQIQEKNFYRIASALYPDGKFKMFNIVEE